MKPWHVNDEDMDEIISENYFTVEGEVVKRQDMASFYRNSEANVKTRWFKMTNFLKQEANRQKYELFEEMMKNEGHEAGIDFFFDEKQNWVEKFANYEWPVLTGIRKPFVPESNVDPSILGIRRIHLVGHVSHHYFGILGNYLTSNVLKLNSAVIGSKRTSIGIPNTTLYLQIGDHQALNHYQITDIDEIREAMNWFRRIITYPKNRRLSEEGDGLPEEFIKSVEGEMRKKNEANLIDEKIDYERDYDEKLKLELVKTVNILDFTETSNLIKLSQQG